MARNSIGGVNDSQESSRFKETTTDLAYNTTWGSIRIYSLAAEKAGALGSVDFKAFVKTFRDSFSPGWKETQYPNQSVPIAHQVTPRRIIQIAFSVPAVSEAEAIKNMQKCSFMANNMYPIMQYEGSANAYRLQSNFMAIKFANLIQNTDGGPLPGYISSFSFIPNFEEGVFVLHRHEREDKDLKKLARRAFKLSDQSYIIPKLVDIDLEFKPIEVRDKIGLGDLNGKLQGGKAGPQNPKVGWQRNGWPHGVRFSNHYGVDKGGRSGGKSLSPNTALDTLMKGKLNKIFK